MLNAAPRQQASRPDTRWARRAITVCYCDAFRGPPCPIARAGQTQDVVGRVQSDRSAVSDQPNAVPRIRSSALPGWTNGIAHRVGALAIRAGIARRPCIVPHPSDGLASSAARRSNCSISSMPLYRIATPTSCSRATRSLQLLAAAQRLAYCDELPSPLTARASRRSIPDILEIRVGRA